MRTSCTALIVIALVAVVSPCAWADTWRPPRPVQIEGKTGWTNLSSFVWWAPGGEDGERKGLLLRDGDYFVHFDDDDLMFPYVSSDGTELTITTDEWSTRLADEIVAVSLKQSEGLHWLETASENELDAIRFIALPEDLDEAVMPAVERLAATNPDVGMSVESRAVLLRVVPLFHTRALLMQSLGVGGFRPDVREVLAKQRQLETVMISAEGFFSLDFLPDLPDLRNLFIFDWDVETAGPLPAGLSGLKSLAVDLRGCGVNDLFALSAAPAGLEELSIKGGGAMTDLSGLEELPNLRVLRLGMDSADLSSLDSLRQLRWLHLPQDVTPQQLASVVRSHPDLTILEMSGGIDLAPLAELKGLEGLVLFNTSGDLDALQGMRSLRFVGVGCENEDETCEEVCAIREALPDALVVQVLPLCLGSGWILLLIPAIALFWFLEPLRPRRIGRWSA